MQFTRALKSLTENEHYQNKSNSSDPGLLGILKSVTDGLKESKNREMMDYKHINRFATILGQELEVIVKEEESGVALNHHDLSVECLRCLRNGCVECEHNQDMLCDTETIGIIKRFVEILTRRPEGSGQETLLRCAVQVLSNASSGNRKTQESIWKCIFPDTLLKLLKFADSRVQTYTCMLIYHCVTSDLQQLEITQPIVVMETILELSTKETENDWCLQIIQELLTKSSDLFLQCYGSLSVDSKVTLLDITAALLSNNTDNSLLHQQVAEETVDEASSIPRSSVEFVAEKFEEVTKPLTGFVADAHSRKEIELLIPLRLLKVLCFATANLNVYRPLQDRTSLLICTVGLLQSVHLVQHKTEQASSHSQRDDHPSHGFKRDLIRLVGNMCFRNTVNQNKVRELDGITFLLDNCTIDPSNPFISQWATLAIRNVCENNSENQKVIEGMNVQGMASNSMLHDMGIETQLRDGQVYVKTKPK